MNITALTITKSDTQQISTFPWLSTFTTAIKIKLPTTSNSNSEIQSPTVSGGAHDHELFVDAAADALVGTSVLMRLQIRQHAREEPMHMREGPPTDVHLVIRVVDKKIGTCSTSCRGNRSSSFNLVSLVTLLI